MLALLGAITTLYLDRHDPGEPFTLVKTLAACEASPVPARIAGRRIHAGGFEAFSARGCGSEQQMSLVVRGAEATWMIDAATVRFSDDESPMRIQLVSHALSAATLANGRPAVVQRLELLETHGCDVRGCQAARSLAQFVMICALPRDDRRIACAKTRIACSLDGCEPIAFERGELRVGDARFVLDDD